MDNTLIQPFTSSMLSMIPAILLSLVAALIWRKYCFWKHRKSQAEWERLIDLSEVNALHSIEQRVKESQLRLMLVKQGSPADRLFFAGLFGFSLVLILVLGGIVLKNVFI